LPLPLPLPCGATSVGTAGVDVVDDWVVAGVAGVDVVDDWVIAAVTLLFSVVPEETAPVTLPLPLPLPLPGGPPYTSLIDTTADAKNMDNTTIKRKPKVLIFF